MFKARKIDGGVSLLLDGLRLSAALVVLLWHAKDMWFPAGSHSAELPGNPSHAAVVVFFVLSGFVIAFTATAKHRTLSEYFEARLGRLCSMVIPALILTAVVELAVRASGDADLISTYVRGTFGPRYLITGSFMNELWFFSAAPPANIALWSLSFEFWYYVIFGVWFCTGRGWKSWAFALVACVIAGPKIVAMMPIWLMGCAAYWLPRPRLGRGASSIAVLLALSAAVVAILAIPPLPKPIGEAPLYFANQFLTDWAAGIFVALALWLTPSWSTEVARPISPELVSRVRRLADLTFPIYVLHFPLLVLWRTLFGTRLNDVGHYSVAVFTVLLISSALGVILERKRSLWTIQFRRFLASIQRRPRAV